MQDVIPKGGEGAIQNAQGAIKSVVTVVKWYALTSVETSDRRVKINTTGQ